jgi:antitoxin component of MazEF toxin-antitoxin module
VGTRRYSEFNQRTVSRSGSGSYSITIPVNLLRELKWREGQQVSVIRKGKQLIITDIK